MTTNYDKCKGYIEEWSGSLSGDKYDLFTQEINSNPDVAFSQLKKKVDSAVLESRN